MASAGPLIGKVADGAALIRPTLLTYQHNLTRRDDLVDSGNCERGSRGCRTKSGMTGVLGFRGVAARLGWWRGRGWIATAAPAKAGAASR